MIGLKEAAKKMGKRRNRPRKRIHNVEEDAYCDIDDADEEEFRSQSTKDLSAKANSRHHKTLSHSSIDDTEASLPSAAHSKTNLAAVPSTRASEAIENDDDWW